jgi:hypothetical protein
MACASPHIGATPSPRPPTRGVDRLRVPRNAGASVTSTLRRTGLGGQSVVYGRCGGKSSREPRVWGDNEGRTAHTWVYSG